jgi:hypothetical protein
MTPARITDERLERRRGGDPGGLEPRGRTPLPGDTPDVPDGPDGPGDPAGDDAVGSNRSERAVREPMAVYALRDDDQYLVDTDGGTYVVDLESDTCTCPDHAIRGNRCKHLRRVDMEVGVGRVPAPGERVAACAVCGGGVYVSARETGAFLCGDHHPTTGLFVRNRETDKLLVVTGVTTTRADEYRTTEDRLISEYETNADYGDHEPVVEAVYAGNAVGSPGPLGVSGRRTYGFPASRLRRLSPTKRPRNPVIGL